MSQTAHIRSHRKPRPQSASRIALRAGVAGGVLSTVAVAAAGTASADPVTQTIEMPTLTDALASTAAESANATQLAAYGYELQAEQDAAAEKAAKAAKKAKAEADRKEEARKQEAKRIAAERAAEQAASRSAERTTLTTASYDAPAATGNVASLIAFLKAQVGKPYVMGATGPSAYDCSGLTQAAFKTVGVNLPRTSQQQSTFGTPVAVSDVQPGDLVFWGGTGSAYHVAVYIGDGKYLDAANPSKGVVIQEMSYYMPTTAMRVL
ncbi:C40 family peptidase [Streptomyces sp. GC420]|uniref:C40 family peptidase n=1 Tax=Streptomyces sp. GC420 TaxID=2697568 RepID=UPI001414FC8D|nr:C40 family peptidase [Streptomyces sp. GC420]NBM15665.1 glycoside hydrolase [Streptomyces sp. GC420]